MQIAPVGATKLGITHHRVALNGTDLHDVSAGAAGSPILLVHGFPETWWAFHKLIPLLAESHRVFAVDLRGFGDSATGPGSYDSTLVAADLYHLITHLDVGPVHLTGQDIAGASIFRLATTYPDALDQAALNRNRFHADNLIYFNRIEHLIRVQTDAGCSSQCHCHRDGAARFRTGSTRRRNPWRCLAYRRIRRPRHSPNAARRP